jgi:hypothetical protein
LGAPDHHATGGSASVAATEPSETYLVSQTVKTNNAAACPSRSGKDAEHTGCHGHALAAMESQPHGIDVADDCCGAGQRRNRGSARREADNQDRRCSLGDVEEHDHDPAPRVCRAKHIGRPNVAAACHADIDTRAPSQKEGKRHRSRKITE